MAGGVRIDKWLWVVRIFRTRSQATIACRSGQVKAGERVVKPSHEVTEGDIICIRFPAMERKVRVTGLTDKRVSAPEVTEFMEDLTLPEEYEKLKRKRETGFEHRLRGLGRPTKRQRREIDHLKKFLGE